MRDELAGAPGELVTREGALAAWLALPEPWRAPDFIAAAAAEGVRPGSAEACVVGKTPPPDAVLLSLGPDLDHEGLRAAGAGLRRALARDASSVEQVA